MKLSGQVAVVTGAGRGIGRAIADAQAKAGAKVALLARTAGEIEAAAATIGIEGGTARAYATDIVDREAVETVFAAIERDLGPVSLLANNAGSFTAFGPIWTVDPEAWWRDIEINVRGTFNCCRAAIPGCSRASADDLSTWSAAEQEPLFQTARATPLVRPDCCVSPNAFRTR